MNKPTLFKRKGSRWWWFSYYTKSGRMQLSARKLKLSVDDYTKEEAQKVIFERFNIETGISGPEDLLWFKNDLLKRFQLEGLRDSTIKEYRIAIEHLISLLGESLLVVQVKKPHVFQLQKALVKKGDTPATVNKICRHLRGAFERLYDDEVIERNPFKKFRPIHEPQEKPKHLTVPQLKIFLETVNRSSNEPGKRLVYIFIATGLRRSEVLLINRNDIDLENTRVRVQNIKHRHKVKRWITIPEAVHDDFKWFLNKYPNKQYPFLTCNADTVTHWVKEWIREAGFSESLHLHSLRHTFTTLALESGESVWRLRDHVVKHFRVRVSGPPP